MAEQKESSVLFSLKELMNLEEDRIRQEEAERRRQEEEAVQARLELERRARDEEEARLRAIEEERLAGEQRQREEAARLEAIHQAEIERARLEAENAARLQQLRNQQEHAERIAAISQDQSKKKLRNIAIASGAFLVLALVGGGMIIKNSMDKQEQLEHQIAEINEESAKLREKLGHAKSPEEVAELQQKLAENAQAMQDLQKGTPAPDKPRHVVTAPKAANPSSGASPTDNSKPCTCQKGDPLCDCFGK